MNNNNRIESRDAIGLGSSVNDGDLRGAHVATKPPVNMAGRIVGAVFLVVALGLGAAYTYENWPHQAQKSVVADSRLPAPAPR
jgi:hypothetical protein